MTTLNSISSQDDYNEVIAKLIPAQNQAGLGMSLSSSQWIKTIKRLKNGFFELLNKEV